MSWMLSGPPRVAGGSAGLGKAPEKGGGSGARLEKASTAGNVLVGQMIHRPRLARNCYVKQLQSEHAADRS
jgi:hypothetical protein